MQALISSVVLFMEWLLISPPSQLTREQYGKLEPENPESGHCQSVLRPQGVFNVTLFNQFSEDDSAI